MTGRVPQIQCFVYFFYFFISRNTEWRTSTWSNCFLWRCGRTLARAYSFTRFLDHTQPRTTVGRTPLDEWSASRRDLYLTTYDTHNRQTSTPPVGFEPTISAGERPQTHALDRAATGTGYTSIYLFTHNDASQSVGLLWTSDQLVAETSTWQHTTLTTDKYPCPRWDSNPRSQQASGRSPTPLTARLLGPLRPLQSLNG